MTRSSTGFGRCISRRSLYSRYATISGVPPTDTLTVLSLSLAIGISPVSATPWL